MDPTQPFSAMNVVNEYEEKQLAKIILEYGEERWAARIAKFIVENRPIHTTGELTEIIKAAIPAKARRQGPTLQENFSGHSGLKSTESLRFWKAP